MAGLILAFTAAAFATAIPALARTEYWHQRVTLFDKLPVSPGDIVFLGNSITDGGEFTELFHRKNALNRGISGDVISGVKERLHQVTKGHPAKIFLLIGINDVSHGKSASRIASEYESLVKQIRKESPESKLYLQSVMPIDNSFKRYKNLFGRENVVPALNKEIERIAAENGCTYIDLWPALATEKGTLKKDFTNDGLHLTGNGYKAWANAIREYVDEPVTPAPEAKEETQD